MANNKEFSLKNMLRQFLDPSDEIRAKVMEERAITHNSVAFVGMTGGVGTSTIASNVGVLLAEQGKKVCVVDLNLRLPSLNVMFGTRTPDSNDGLLTRIYKPEKDTRSIVQETGIKNLFIISASFYDDIHDCSDMTEDHVYDLFLDLSSMFDVVIYDVPLLFDLETTVFSILQSSLVYTVFNTDIVCLQNRVKVDNFFSDNGIHNKFNNILVNQAYPEISNAHLIKSGLLPVAVLPYTSAVPINAAAGSVLVKGSRKMDAHAKEWINKCVDIANSILSGLTQ